MKKKIIDKIKEFISNNPVLILYVFGNFFNAILLRLFTTGKFQLRSIFCDLAFVFLMGSFSFLIKKRKYLYFGLTTFILTFVCMTNSLYYNYYSSFASVSLLATSVFVKDVGDAVVDMVIRPYDLTYLLLIIAMIFGIKKYEVKHDVSVSKFAMMFVLALCMFGIGCALPPYNSYSRLYKLWNRVMVVNSWGPYVYQIDDIVQSLKPKFNNVFGRDNALEEVKAYYKDNKSKVSNNEYSGIFDGKNVIAIHAESLQEFVIGLTINDIEITPNLNRLVSNGMHYNNFYAQVGVGTSSDTEFTYSTSLLPANNGTVFVNYYNDHFVTMQNLLKNKGYYVFSMHGNVGDFWNRENMHKNMGYDKLYSKSSFEIDEEYGLGLSDESFFRQVVPMIKEINDSLNMPFYGTLITLTNHTPWRDADEFSDLDFSINVDIEGEIFTRQYLEDTLMGRYLKSVHYMDMAIGNFIDDMEEAGLLDNTIIVIYGDHDARLGINQFNYMYNYDPITDSLKTELDEGYVDFNSYEYELSKKVPLIIWNKDMNEGKEIDTPMGMIDVLPTLGNMLNIYNKYSLGQDIMNIDKEKGIVVFKDGSFITDKLYYNAKNTESYMLSSVVIPDDYVSNKVEYADKIIEISNNVIVYDLIKDLD